MAMPILPILLGVLALIIRTFTAYSPMMAIAEPPRSSSPWADEPISLIHTPAHESKQIDQMTVGASHVALVHNVLLRGYNSIYLQAEHVQEDDKAAFVGYCLTWHKLMENNRGTEATLRGNFEMLFKDDSVLDEVKTSHEAFADGLDKFKAYLTTLPTPTALSGSKLVSIMRSFQKPLGQHYQQTPKTIAALNKHPNAPKPNSQEALIASAMFQAWVSSTIALIELIETPPFFLMNLDKSFEGGMWADWPPMPAAIRWNLVNVGGLAYSARWKFASCDAKGKRRELYALGFAKQTA